MPLPHIKKLCSAKSKRTGLPCRNPAAYGCRTCKTHGAHRIRRGKDAPNFKSGMYSESRIAEYRADMSRLQHIEEIGFLAGLLKGHRTKGRKIKTGNKTILHQKSAPNI